VTASVLSDFLAVEPEVPGSIPVLPDYLSNRRSGTGSTQPRENE
jgi:hypothetical protein